MAKLISLGLKYFRFKNNTDPYFLYCFEDKREFSINIKGKLFDLLYESCGSGINFVLTESGQQRYYKFVPSRGPGSNLVPKSLEISGHSDCMLIKSVFIHDGVWLVYLCDAPCEINFDLDLKK